jgi:diguanylate cyclase (GGDEF)-like protein
MSGDKAKPDQLSRHRLSRYKANFLEIIDKNQNHLIVQWDVWVRNRHLKEIGLPSLLCLIAVFFLTLFAIESFMMSQILHGQILLIVAIIMVVLFFLLNLTENNKLTNSLMVFIMGSLCIFLFYTGGVNQTGPLWYFVFPLFALFIQRLWTGLLSIILLFLITVLIYVIQPANFDSSIYEPIYVERFMAIYMAISAICFFYVFTRTSSELMMSNLSKNYQEMANTDELTRLANRRYMREILNREMSRAIRFNRTFSVISFDLDHFKEINDNYGHDAGDDVLLAITSILAGILRTQDICARWGGEEFLIMLPETKLEGAQQVAERLRVAMEQYPIKYKDQEFKMTLSAGCSEYRIKENLDVCLKRSDDNLYQAKKKGRNRVEI